MKNKKTNWLYSEVDDRYNHKGDFFKALLIAIVLSITIMALIFTCIADRSRKEKNTWKYHNAK
jgi:hypothetical protein